MTRLPPPFGLLIDRDREVGFSFEGRRYSGLAGDCIAAALAANGEWLLSRSFKYRRPRGVLTMAGQDANTLVQLPGDPNVLADRYPVTEGLQVRGQNYNGSLRRDWGRWIEKFARFLPVGFYYKAFYRPKGAWRFWEPVVRKRAGLGTVDVTHPHGYFDKAYAFTDVVVAGGGPAGLSAALQAAEAGADVLLIEENPILGGALAYARFDAAGTRAQTVRRQLIDDVHATSNITVMTDATANGWFTDNWIPIIQGNRMIKLRAGSVVVAAGSMEQPAVFANNDLPGIMFGTAAQRLMRLYAVPPGKRAVVLTANDDGYGVALDLHDAGVEVAAVLDLRIGPKNGPCASEAQARGIDVRTGAGVVQAIGDPRRQHLTGVTVGAIGAEGGLAATPQTLACDLLCVSVGYAPTAHLLLHAGGTVGYDETVGSFALHGVPDHLFPAGSVNNIHDLDAVLADGRRAGWAAAADAGFNSGEAPSPSDPGNADRNHPYPIFPHARIKSFVDFDEDLTVADLANGIADGFDHIELLKRYSTVGMGPSQGRHAALNAARIVANATGRPAAEVGASTSRPPFTAEKFGHLAGRGFHPVRHTAMHHRHLEAGAQMMVAGLWLRPAWYGAKDQGDTCATAEAANVHANVGLIDVSTLGGLEVRGPDAAEFMNRIYTFAYKRQAVGRARYVLMTDRLGAIVDDGVACRFHDDHFYVTATTGGVDGVYRQMLWWNAQWRLDVDVTNVTAAYAGVNIAGPKARAVMENVCDGVDLSAEAFPYMGVREGNVAGIPARLLRVGFVGELGYEIHVPASQGEALWDLLLQAGAEADIKPFGVEAQRLLRLEKGHIIVGQDSDGLTHPLEADMAWAISRNKPYFVGKRAIEMHQNRGLERKLTGFTLPYDISPLPKESHLVVRDSEIVGRVTSIARSAVVRKTIGLAYVAPDQAEIGTRFAIKAEGGAIVEAVVAPLPFYDPENKRQEV